jgi:SAM-dependent methyltransferase
MTPRAEPSPEPRPEQAMERIERDTAELYGEIFTSVADREFEAFQALYTARAFGEPEGFFRGKRVLELAPGGTGSAVASFVAQGAAEVVAIDLSSRNVENLGRRFAGVPNVVLRQGDICDLPTDLGQFDFAHAAGVLHTIRDPDKALRDACGLLRPGGKVVVSLYGKGGLFPRLISLARGLRHVVPQRPVYEFLLRRWKFGAYFVMDYVYAPILLRFTEREALAFVERAGFHDVERLPTPVVYDRSPLRFLMQSQSDHRKLHWRLLHGHGFIYVKGVK